MKKNIELEYRARFSRKKYQSLSRFLHQHARDLGDDHKRIWFFVMPDKLLKVTWDFTHKTAKVTLKLRRIGQGSHFPEMEFPIAVKDVAHAVKLFAKLHPQFLVEPKVIRRNFIYKGVELALKFSKTWGYHLELEIMLKSTREKPLARKKIRQVAKELGVKIMTEKELRVFTGNIENKYFSLRKINC